MSAFNHRQEKVEVYLDGGKPWGFAIKGGNESNRPLVISKVRSCTNLLFVKFFMKFLWCFR